MMHPCSQLTSNNLSTAFTDSTGAKPSEDCVDAAEGSSLRSVVNLTGADELVPTPASSLPVHSEENPDPRADGRVKVGESIEGEVSRHEEFATPMFPAISANDKQFIAPSAVSASDALQRTSIASAFKSSSVSLRPTLRATASESNLATPKRKSAHAEGRKTVSSKAVRRKYPVSKTSKLYRAQPALRVAKQQDRIADDYYQLLRHCAH